MQIPRYKTVFGTLQAYKGKFKSLHLCYLIGHLYKHTGMANMIHVSIEKGKQRKVRSWLKSELRLPTKFLVLGLVACDYSLRYFAGLC